uniref:uncharacterized protein LOC122592546 isoform X2 n=1 Tax=Erigeron canadensis TaxID=72917 RepID=UPI001CB90A6C|nr:uncharacterized protein LOC122592546 isoform X2 [Erigeron canadensis]
MGDLFRNHVPSTSYEAAQSTTSRKDSKLTLVASGSKLLSHASSKQIPLFNNMKLRQLPANDMALFLLKVGWLEMVRRLSKAKCPFVWSGLQALQVFCYPPLKWLQRWAPFRNLIKGAQIMSRPLLVLSIATALYDQSGQNNLDSVDIENSDRRNDCNDVPGSLPELSSSQSTVDVRVDDEALSHQPCRTWLLDLYRELDNQGVRLSERINEDELSRFHSAANGDFSCLVTLVKKSIRWRETYRFLSEDDLEMWSNMVFWHGFDVKNRPCLFIRLVACIRLPPSERPRFAQAIVSQVEHGILNLVDAENPQVTVLVDCEGLSIRFPMQLLRSCAATLQENYPNRLGCLFIIRLPSVGRVIAQTFIQIQRTLSGFRDMVQVTSMAMKMKIVSRY